MSIKLLGLLLEPVVCIASGCKPYNHLTSAGNPPGVQCVQWRTEKEACRNAFLINYRPSKELRMKFQEQAIRKVRLTWSVIEPIKIKLRLLRLNCDYNYHFSASTTIFNTMLTIMIKIPS